MLFTEPTSAVVRVMKRARPAATREERAKREYHFWRGIIVFGAPQPRAVGRWASWRGEEERSARREGHNRLNLVSCPREEESRGDRRKEGGHQKKTKKKKKKKTTTENIAGRSSRHSLARVLLDDFEGVGVLEVGDVVRVDEFVGAGVVASVHHALGRVHPLVPGELEDVGCGLGRVGADHELVGVGEAHFFGLVLKLETGQDLVLDLEGNAELVLDAFLDRHAVALEGGHAGLVVRREHEVRERVVEHHAELRHHELARVRRVPQVALRRRAQ
mmetsp:Transcript_27024/g.82958  ORF Transcript_27024/g.82958 Transcript_27024/m.82958 type:complete len:274 (+) Transcript_27024:33-854(+)